MNMYSGSDSINNYYLVVFPVSLLIIIVYVAVNSLNIKQRKRKILPETVDKRLEQFTPLPLVETCEEFIEPELDENDEDTINLVKVNYLNILNNREFKEAAQACIRTYGVGSCGPRGFYGTIDIHLNLEQKIAEFMNLEESILYSSGFSTIASAIGAYCRKGDVIFCDEKISFASREGMNAGRSTVIYFKHNDTGDLENKLQGYTKSSSDFKKSKQACRKFLIVEGIYGATGTICPLPEFLRLCKEHMLRIFVDESFSFGVLGEHGRGVTEHFKIDASKIDIIIATLEGAVGSIGGFSVGASVIIEHQRLYGLGYCFSASLPPFLADVAIRAIDKFQNNPEMFTQLRRVAIKMHKLLLNIGNLTILSDPLSPLKVFKHDVLNAFELHRRCINRKLYVSLNETDNNISLNISANMDDKFLVTIINILEIVCEK